MSGSSGVESDDDKEIVEHSNSNKRHEKQHKSRKEKGTRKNSNGHDSNQTTEGDSPPHKKVRTDNDNDDSTNDAPGKTEKADNLMTKTGGAYIPPARLRLMQKDITDKTSETYQRISWEALKKSINGLVNKVNTSNIKEIVLELLQENIVRGRGLLARSILAAQNASPTFTNVYAALVAIINSRFPQNGELILRRVVAQFRRSFKRNIKDMCLHSCQFIAHLINQQVAHEILGLQILTLLLETPTDDSVEVGIGFLKECGQKLTEVSPRGLAAVFEQLRLILNEQQLEKRVQYMIEVMFAIRKDGFKEHPPVIEELDQVDENDQFTHMLTVDDDNIAGLENQLNVFRLDPDFQNTEDSYKKIKAEILDESDRSGSEGSTSESSDDDQAEDDEEAEEPMEITDKTETNLVALRRTIYLAIQSSLSFEECAHKIMKMEFTENDYPEICAMIIDCCSQQRTYEKFFGLLAGRFACLKQKFMEQFEIQFAQQYETIHRLETSKLRNVAKFFAHLLHSDSLPWSVLSNIVLSEDTTTSSARIFIKILLLEVTEYMGVSKFNERLKDPTLAPFFEGLFPRNNPKATRFAINFFTTIGLGSLTEDLREHLKQSAKQMQQKMQAEQLAALAAAASSSSSDESASSASPDESSDGHKKKKKKKNKKSSKKKKKKAKKLKRKKSKKSRREATPSPARTSSDESEQNTVTHAPVSAKPEKEDLRTRLMRLANMVPGASGDAPPAPTPVAPVVTASANENDSFVERMKAKCLKNRNKGNKSPEVASFEHRSNSPSESDGSDVRKALIRERSVSREKSTEPRSMEQRNVVRQRSDSPQSTNGQDQSHLTRSPQAQMNHGRSQRSRSDSRRPGRSRGSRSDSRRRPRSPHRSRSHSRRNGISRRDRRSRSDSRRDRTSRRERRSRSDSRRNRTSRRERRSRSDSRRNRSSRRGRRSRSDSRRDRTSRRDRRSRSDSRRDRTSRRDRRSRSNSRRDRTSRRERRSRSNSRRNRTSRRDRRSRSNSRRNQTSRRIRRSHSSPRRDTIARRDRSHSSEIPKSYQINIRRSRSHSRGVQNYRSSRKYARNQSSSTDSEEEQASSPGYVKSDGNSDNSDVHSSSDDSGVVSKSSLKPHNSARGKDSKNAPKTVERGATVSKTLQDTQNDLVIKKNSTGDSHTHQATSSGDAGRAGRSQVKTKGGKSDTNSARDGNTSSGYRKDHKSLNKGSDSDDSQNESDHDDLQIHNNKRDGDRDSSCDSQMSVGDESSPKEELSIDARIGGREVENESRSNPPDDNSVGDGNSPTCSPADYRSPNRRSESNGWESDAGDLKRDQSDRDRDSSCDSRMSVDGQNSPEELCEDVRTGNLRGDVIESEKRPSVDRHSEAQADYATKSRSQSRSTSGESSPDGKVATNNQRQKNVDRSESSSSSVQSPKANTDNWSDSAENKDSVIPAKSPRTPDDHPYSLAQNNSAKETITREGSYHASDVSDESDTKHRRLTAGKNNGELKSPRTSEEHRRKRRTTRSASPTSSEESPGHAEEDDHRKKSSVKRSDSKDRFDRSAEREKKKKEQRKPRRRSPSVEKSLPNKAHQIIRRMSDDDGDNSSSSDDSTTRQAKGTRRDRSRHMIHREHSDEETARYRKKLSSRDREHDSKGRKGSSRSRHRKGKRSSEKRGSTPEKSMSPVRRRHERKRSRDRRDRRSSRRSSRRRDRKSSRRARRSESEDSRSNSSAASDDDRRRRRVHTGRSRHHY